MALPTPYTLRSYAGAATPSYLNAALSGSFTVGQQLTVANTSDWYETTVSGTQSSNPLGTSGPFTLVVDYGTATEEKILCSGTVTVASSGSVVNVWYDGTLNGRAYDGSSLQAHASGTSSGLNVFPVMSAAEVVGFNASATNPYPGVKPSLHNLKAWTIDPGAATVAGVLPSSGTIACTALYVPYATTVTGISAYVTATGVGVTSVTYGLYNSTTLLASGSSASWFQALNTQNAAFTSPVTISAGTYWVAVSVVASTTYPQIYRNGGAYNWNQTAVSGSLTIRSTTLAFGSSTLPATITGTPGFAAGLFLFGLY